MGTTTKTRSGERGPSREHADCPPAGEAPKGVPVAGGLNRARAARWSKELGKFFSWQIGITIVNMVAGLLIIRFLDKLDYAFYTVGFAATGIFTAVSDSGVTPIVNSIAGKDWQHRGRMGSVINTALGFQKEVGLWLALPLTAYAIWQYRLIDASWTSAVVLTLIFGVIGLSTLETSILKIPIIFAKRVVTTQRLELRTSLLKLVLVVALGLTIPGAVSFAIGTAVATLYALGAFRKEARSYADLAEGRDRDTRANILGLFKLNAPGTLYWSFQGQITVLLCSLFATTENVAEIGALGRLALIFGILNTFVGGYLLPEVSKATTARRILQIAAAIMGIYVLATAALMAIAYFEPQLLLLILGSQYRNLQDVLLLFVGTSMIGVFQGLVAGICASRGWLKWFALYIPLTVVTQIILLLRVDLSQLRGIIVFNGVVGAVTLCMAIGVFAYELSKFSRQSSNGLVHE